MKKQGSGWHGESRRHSLARKGVKTAKGMPTPEERRLAQLEQDEMIRQYAEEEDRYYEYLEEMQKLPDKERILDPELAYSFVKNPIMMGRIIERADENHYYDGEFLKKLSWEEYLELSNLYASYPRIIRPIHLELARKGWVSLYDGYYDAIIPSKRAWNPNVMADLEHDKSSWIYDYADVMNRGR